jgi:hypothetical protein
MAFIRDPKASKADATCRAGERNITDADLRALAEYLNSLK